jgi:hypothetical protein
MQLARRFVAGCALLVFIGTVHAASAYAGAWTADSTNSVSVGASSTASSPGSRPIGKNNGNGTSASRHGGTANPSPSQCALVPLASSTALPPGGSIPGQWYVMSCNGQAFIPSTGLFWIPYSKAVPTTGVVDPQALAEQAAKSIVLPDPTIHTNPSDTTIVNFTTWLWVSAEVWHAMNASATAGSITATATATPTSVTWTMGDGSTAVCDGPGTPYYPSQPLAGQSTNCSYTYRSSSAGEPSVDGNPNDGAYPVTASITWAVTWTVAGASGGGALPPLRTSSTIPLRVEQVESVQTGN